MCLAIGNMAVGSKKSKISHAIKELLLVFLNKNFTSLFKLSPFSVHTDKILGINIPFFCASNKQRYSRSLEFLCCLCYIPTYSLSIYLLLEIISCSNISDAYLDLVSPIFWYQWIFKSVKDLNFKFGIYIQIFDYFV